MEKFHFTGDFSRHEATNKVTDTSKVYFGIGGNLDNREKNLAEAIQLLEERVGKIIAVSSLYETKAWGIENQPDFLNQTLIIETSLSPQETLQTILAIELEMGRVREQKWYARLIDIDILFYENLIIEEKDLDIPHPFISKRNFVLAPLAEIAGGYVHPILQKSVSELYFECPDKLAVFALNPSMTASS